MIIRREFYFSDFRPVSWHFETMDSVFFYLKDRDHVNFQILKNEQKINKNQWILIATL